MLQILSKESKTDLTDDGSGFETDDSPTEAECLLVPEPPGLVERLFHRGRHQNIGVDMSGRAVCLLRLEASDEKRYRLAEYARVPVMEPDAGIPEICKAARPFLKNMHGCAPLAGVWLAAEHKDLYVLHDSIELVRDRDPAARILDRLPHPPTMEERNDWIVDFIQLSSPVTKEGRRKENHRPQVSASSSEATAAPAKNGRAPVHQIVAGAISADEVEAFEDQLENDSRLDGVMLKSCAVMNLYEAGLLPIQDGVFVELAVGWREYRIGLYSLDGDGELLHYRRVRGGLNSLVEAVENELEEMFPDSDGLRSDADTLLMQYLNEEKLQADGTPADRISEDMMTAWLFPVIQRAAWQIRQTISQVRLYEKPSRLLVSGEAAVPHVCAMLGQALEGKMTVLALDPLSHPHIETPVVSLPEKQTDRTGMATALGLALPRSRKRMLNFLISYDEREKQQARHRSEWIAAVLLVLFMITLALAWGWLEREIRRESSALVAEQQIFAEAVAVFQKELTTEMIEAESTLLRIMRRQKRHQILRMAPAGLLRDLSGRIPEGVVISRLTLQAIAPPDNRGIRVGVTAYTLHMEAFVSNKAGAGAVAKDASAFPSSVTSSTYSADLAEQCRLALADSPYITETPVLKFHIPSSVSTSDSASGSPSDSISDLSKGVPGLSNPQSGPVSDRIRGMSEFSTAFSIEASIMPYADIPKTRSVKEQTAEGQASTGAATGDEN